MVWFAKLSLILGIECEDVSETGKCPRESSCPAILQAMQQQALKSTAKSQFQHCTIRCESPANFLPNTSGNPEVWNEQWREKEIYWRERGNIRIWFFKAVHFPILQRCVASNMYDGTKPSWEQVRRSFSTMHSACKCPLSELLNFINIPSQYLGSHSLFLVRSIFHFNFVSGASAEDKIFNHITDTQCLSPHSQSLVSSVTASSDHLIPISNVRTKSLHLPKYQINDFVFHRHCTTPGHSSTLTVD